MIQYYQNVFQNPSQMIYQYSRIPVKTLAGFGGGAEINKSILKFIRRQNEPRIAKAVEKELSRIIIVPDLET